ncbi:MAG: hypothetical protein KW788_02860 [Candidatus Doudnabacteria bacterium]|nr:hypothetical protein [Candidatus Doudnabacteria bacterium]
MNDKINQIMEDLIKLDPGFAKHRTELQKILYTLLSARPDPVIDTAFVRKLRVKLLEEMENRPNLNNAWSRFKESFMKKIIVSASAVVVLLVVALVGLQKLQINNSEKGLPSFGSDVRVVRAADGAFGNLATLSLAVGGKGGGGGAAQTDAAVPSTAFGMGGGSGISEKMMPYEPINYKYVYKGEDLNLSSDKLDVLKKQVPDTQSLLSGLQSLGMGLVNMDSFPGSKPQSISFNQQDGYNIYIDFMGGTVSISGYFDGPMYAAESKLACPLDGCPTPAPVKESDIPDDATLIATANQFLADHGISTSAYGQPEVMNDYRVQIQSQLKASPKSFVYWPEYINVVYPLKIQNDEVYDESGNKVGLMVGVNIRSNKVTSVYNLSTQNYEASSYDAVTDPARILKVAEKGGMYGYFGDAQGKIVEIELGTPTLQYVSMWDYQINNSTQQVLVPSLVFPVLKQPTDAGFYRKSVVVPLIKNILDRDTNPGFGGGPVKIMESTASPSATK